VRARAAGLLVAGLVVLGACGGGEPDVSEPAARLLDAQVAAVRTAAAGRDRAATAEQLASLRANVARLRQQGEITRDAATRIERAADAVAAQLTLIPLPTTTTTTTVPPPERDDRDQPGRGHDKEKPGKEKPGKEKPPGPGHRGDED
jgi:hypothetical protein